MWLKSKAVKSTAQTMIYFYKMHFVAILKGMDLVASLLAPALTGDGDSTMNVFSTSHTGIGMTESSIMTS
jgi:hypothetical protein